MVSITSVAYIENILSGNWTASITDRDVNVPEPQFVKESDASLRRMDLQQNDYIIVSDGGVAEFEPKSLAWGEEDITSHVSLDIRTTDSRERLLGNRDSNNNAENYGGLTGECKRIIDTKRDRDKEYDLIIAQNVNDISGQMGGKVWRAIMDIRLEQRAVTIDPST